MWYVCSVCIQCVYVVCAYVVWYVYECICVGCMWYVCVYKVFMCVVCMWACGGWVAVKCLSYFPPYVLRQSFSLNLGSGIGLDWLSNKLQPSHCLSPLSQALGYKCMLPLLLHLAFIWVLGAKLELSCFSCKPFPN